VPRLSAAAKSLVDSSALCHLVTIDPDGSPQVSCIWVGADGDDIVFASMARRRKIENVERDPRVSLSIESTGLNERGLLEYLVVKGTATVAEGGAAELLQHLAHTYLGPEAVFPPGTDDPPAGFVVRITPTRIGGVGHWSE
jgi:PPOX class probable F420-dependent enzyme